jgi:hypothetical protein
MAANPLSLPVPLSWHGAAPADTTAATSIVAAVLGFLVAVVVSGIVRRSRRQGVEREFQAPGALAALDW